MQRIGDSPIERLMMTDSIMATAAVKSARNVSQIEIAPLIAEAMDRISNEKSVSSLWD